MRDWHRLRLIGVPFRARHRLCLLVAAAIKVGIDGNAFSADQSLGIERLRPVQHDHARLLIEPCTSQIYRAD